MSVPLYKGKQRLSPESKKLLRTLLLVESFKRPMDEVRAAQLVQSMLPASKNPQWLIDEATAYAMEEGGRLRRSEAQGAAVARALRHEELDEPARRVHARYVVGRKKAHMNGYNPYARLRPGSHVRVISPYTSIKLDIEHVGRVGTVETVRTSSGYTRVRFNDGTTALIHPENLTRMWGRKAKNMGSPPLPSGSWPRGRKLASFCRRLKDAAANCGGAGSPCRQTAIDRALAASCPWAIKRITPRYSGRLQRY